MLLYRSSSKYDLGKTSEGHTGAVKDQKIAFLRKPNAVVRGMPVGSFFVPRLRSTSGELSPRISRATDCEV